MGSARLRFLTLNAMSSAGRSLLNRPYRGGEAEGTAAASAAALAKPCNASIGAFNVDRGSVSSDSSSDDGAVLGTIPYVAYLCGW